MTNFNDLLHQQLESKRDRLVEETLNQFELQEPASFLRKHDPKETEKLAKEKLKHLLDYENQQILIENGFKLILSHINDLEDHKHCVKELTLASIKIQKEFKVLLEHLNEIYEYLLNYQETPESHNDELGEQETLAETLGISQNTLSSIYNLASHLFTDRKIEDALAIFEVLIFLNPYCYEIWYSKGLCEKNLHHFERAITSFSFASFYNSEAYQPYLQITECLIQVHNFEEAKKYFHHAEEHMSEEIKQQKSKQLTELKKLL